MTDKDPSALSYKDAGVDIDAGNALVRAIKGVAERTRRPGVMGGLGGFGALFELPSGYREPVLVSGTDGVGTKLKLALQTNALDGIGIDLVAMCVNDLVVGGAEPLFFLDYYATGKLDVSAATRVVTGIGRGCELSGCALVGGETAEMPGMYEGSDFDLAGFCVGIVEKSEIIDGRRCRPGDVILGLASSGPHSNGYSLIRKIIEREGATASTQLPSGANLFEALLAPTRIYVKNLLALIKAEPVHALAHITGGGLLENIPRVLPEGVQAVIDRSALPQVEVFEWLAQAGRLADEERYRVFNCGVGMVVCVPAERADAARQQLEASGETVYTLGHLAEGDNETVVIR